MKKIILFVSILFGIISCNSKDYLGNYIGVQESYNLRNEDGSEMIINGNRVNVPNSEYRISLNHNKKVTVIQTNLIDKKTYEYNGSYEILNKKEKYIEIKCKVFYENSNPTFIIIINKNTLKCQGDFGPDFNLTKV
jgi:hypothetical protein